MQIRHGWILGLALVAAGTACAQAYKVVGPDGRVEYTDRPPAGAAKTRLGESVAASPEDNLPFELRQAVQRYPVTLYSTNNCSPCDQGRNLLKARGVPFTEKSVVTGEDSAALAKAEGSTELPVLRVGSQQVKGFAEADWAGYLDAAGYPKQSRLPADFRFREATPLAPRETLRTAAPKPAASAAGPQAPAPTPARDPNNPNGIKF